MSVGTGAPCATITFGDAAAGTWGALWGADKPFFAIASGVGGAVPGAADARLEGSGDGDDWRILSQHAQLTVTPTGEAVRSAAAAGFDQLCRVRGNVASPGEEHDIDCLGRRAARSELPDFGRYESLRDVSAWFDSQDGLALTSLRPRTTSGHADDLVNAVLFEPTASAVVASPRLSTTYTAADAPSRLSLELWLDDDEDADQYPRRAAGEAIGAPTRAQIGDLDVSAVSLHCHGHGREGAGVYLLVRAR